MQEAFIYHERRQRQVSLQRGDSSVLGQKSKKLKELRVAVLGLCGSAPMKSGSCWAQVGKAGEMTGVCAGRKRGFVGLGGQEAVEISEAEEVKERSCSQCESGSRRYRGYNGIHIFDRVTKTDFDL